MVANETHRRANEDFNATTSLIVLRSSKALSGLSERQVFSTEPIELEFLSRSDFHFLRESK